jgi:hypothetical protein|tara:strand:+ start:1647 stop:1868 length:222 start_codon:yes stop_codon:yes gene_type:complete
MFIQACIHNDKDYIWYSLLNDNLQQEKSVICKNPLKNKKFTLYEYNNWLSDSPRFTFGDYKKNFINKKGAYTN